MYITITLEIFNKCKRTMGEGSAENSGNYIQIILIFSMKTTRLLTMSLPLSAQIKMTVSWDSDNRSLIVIVFRPSENESSGPDVWLTFLHY